MRVIGVPILEEFIRGHREVEKPVQAWLAEARNATWETPHELKEQYGNASILGAGRVVFNLKGKSYRLLVRIDYRMQIVRIEKIGTHEEYDGWDL